MTKVTVPFFISHQGCPHTCVFCDQRIISGSKGALPDAAEILEKINSWRSSAADRPVEVAFFGGSFTALPRILQQQLLSPVQPLIASGEVSHIRISTRPDCLTDQTVLWLAGMGVKIIELGVQSMDDAVLLASGRGHTAADTESALSIIKKHGLTAGAQLMPGLPADSLEKSLLTLERVIAAGADFIRIYPVVVLSGTELAAKYRSGEYQPLTVDQGVDVCKRLLHRAMLAGIDVIRIGLQADAGLNSDNVVAGCWHPAFGQLVRSELYYDLVLQLFNRLGAAELVEIACHSARISDLTGHGRKNLERLNKQGLSVKIIKNNDLALDEIEISTLNQKIRASIITNLKY